MNKLKSLLLMVLCAGFIGGMVVNVSAQSGLRQADIDKTIEFFEWALQTKFTAEQRGKYREIKAEQFQADAAGTRRGMNDMLTTFTAVRVKSESEQERVRQAFVPDFVEQMRSVNDAESKFLLSIYENSQTTSDADGETNGDIGDISAIVGKWVWSRTGGTTWTQGGTYVGGNGSRFTYQFSPNGAVEFTGMMNVMQGGCSQQIFQSIKGQASLSGDTLTIRWQPEKFTRDFSCDKTGNYTKTRPAKTENLKISFRDSSGQKQLCIAGSECFSPSN